MRYLSLDQCVLVACSVAGSSRIDLCVRTEAGNLGRHPIVRSTRAFYVWTARNYTIASFPSIWHHINPNKSHASAVNALERCVPGNAFTIKRGGVFLRKTWEECDTLLRKLADIEGMKSSGENRLPTVLPVNPTREVLSTIHVCHVDDVRKFGRKPDPNPRPTRASIRREFQRSEEKYAAMYGKNSA